MRFAVAFSCLLILGSLPALGSSLRNGGFEEVGSNGVPVGWTFQCGGGRSGTSGGKGAFTLDTGVKTEGAQAVRLATDSEAGSNSFCGIAQTLKSLTPGARYCITFEARGEDVGDAWFGGGSGWRERHAFPRGSFEWREFSMEWTMPDGEDSFAFRINLESVTKALWIDDVELSPVAEPATGMPKRRAVPVATLLVEPVAMAQAQAVPVFPAKQTGVDGVFSDWEGEAFSMSKDGVSASFRFAWSEQYLYIALQTDDDVMLPAPEPYEICDYDGVSVAIDPHNEKSPTSFGRDVYVLAFGVVNRTPDACVLQAPEGADPDIVKRAQFAFRREDKTSYYEIAIPWNILRGLEAKEGAAFGLDIALSNRDDLSAWEKSVEWTPGMLAAKRTSDFKTLVLTGPAVPAAWAQIAAMPGIVVGGEYTKIAATLYAREASEGQLALRLNGTVLDEARISLAAGLTECTCLLDGNQLNAGANAIDLAATVLGKTIEAKATVMRSDDDKKALDLIAEQEQRLEGIEGQLESARKEGVAVSYPRADATIARMFCGFCLDDVRNGRYRRAREVATEVRDLLDRAEREMRAGVAVPLFKPGTETIRDGSLWATCAVNGEEEARPVFLTGYGHFQDVVDDIPTLERLGMNIIQIELGPSSVVMENGGVSTEAIDSFLVKALERGRDHGVSVCVLASPHYFPEWALKKCPELRVSSVGSISNSVEAPQARAIYEKHLRALVARIKDQPALNSICLSNEPTYSGAPDDPWRLPLWRVYLQGKHGSIEKVNTLYGTHYENFDDVPQSRFTATENRAAVYDAVRFNQQRFAEWHQWMTGIIHEIAPKLPCHAKVMPLVWARDTVYWGVDPWDFARLSQLNGNDCYFHPNTPRAPWESDWRIQNMYYDLERSMNWIPIFNTENHVMPDGIQGYVNPSHVYTAIWQGAVHGQCASTTWCWARTYDPKSDFEGLILHRAACTAAMSRCGLDLMRLSWEMSALQNVRPRVAILYSNAALVHDERAVMDRDRVYEALNFCGVPVGFVTDEQAAAGWLDKYDCLLTAGTRAVAADAIHAIRGFLKNGKRAISCGRTDVATDEYGRSVEPVKFSGMLNTTLSGAALRDALMKELRRAGIEPEFLLKTPEGKAPFGVEWRSAKCRGRALINMVNLTRAPVTLALPAGEWDDLITRSSLDKTVVLQPNAPVLAAERVNDK